MHELSLLADLIKKIESIAYEQKVTRITGVKVKLGALSHISPEHFREHFLHASQGTAAEGAELVIDLLKDENDPHAQDILLDSLEVEG
ncbi:MAG: hydrogenase maturation nickel metallochaperone HypA [Acidobacteriota bacterium]